MNQSDPNSAGNSGSRQSMPRKGLGRKSTGAIAIAILVAAYSFVQPKLNEKFDWNLPGLKQSASGQVVMDDRQAKPTSDASDSKTSAKQNGVPKTDQRSNKADTKNTKPSADSGTSKKPGPLAEQMKSSGGTTTSNSTKTDKPETSGTDPPDADEGLLYGILREVGAKRYISKAGLMYAPGSAEGHRLEHLRRHVKDDKSRPIHGVFDGEMEGALKTIDSAYERAKKNQRTTKKVDKGRTVYTVDMGKRIGFIGGRAGQQKRNPMARRVRIVLEGNKVITAFPQ